MNEIWMIDHKTIRCHTTIERLKGKLSNYTGAIVTNVYFKHERRTAWDIDISIEKRAAAEKLLRCKTQTNTYDITGHASYQYDPYLSAQKRHHGNEERVLIPGAISKHPPEQFTINSVHYELVSSSGQFCVYALSPGNKNYWLRYLGAYWQIHILVRIMGQEREYNQTY